MMDWITLYVLLFSGYYFNPCSGDTCLAIKGYEVAPHTEVCKDMDCVREALKGYPNNHLNRVMKLEIIGSQVTLKEMEVVSSHDIKEKKK
jgi:hypothetical protein